MFHQDVDMSNSTQPFVDPRVDLAQVLGFPEYPASLTAQPYLNYVANRSVGQAASRQYFGLLLFVVRYLSNSHNPTTPPKHIRALLDDLSTSTNDYFSDTEPGSHTRREDVEDTVLYIVGAYTTLLSSFVHLPIAGGVRKILLSYELCAQTEGNFRRKHPYDNTLGGLICESRLVPNPVRKSAEDDNKSTELANMTRLLWSLKNSSIAGGECIVGADLSTAIPNVHIPSTSQVSGHFLDQLDLLEALHIPAVRVNAYTIKELGAVNITWTCNISRHMLLTRRGSQYILEIFALPCALTSTNFTSGCLGIEPEYVTEVLESYSVLFNAWPQKFRHPKLSRFFKIKSVCWCWSCSASRYRKKLICDYTQSTEGNTTSQQTPHAQYSEYDPLLIELMKKVPSDWTPELFPSLWERILMLDEHLQTAKPWSIWILFRDRRDTLQFWTFFFATIVVFLTFLQVLLSIAQVAGSFT